MSDGVDMDIVKEEASGFDKWVTGLVDLIPTQVYISKDMLPSNGDDKKLTKTEKRKRRLNPETCLTTSKLAFMNMEDSKSFVSKDEDSVVRNAVNPEDLKAKLDAKLKEIRENQNRTTTNRTEDEQNAIRQKRKAKKEKQKKMKKAKTVVENGMNGMKSPDRKITGQSGKVIFNKFDLIQDPIEKEKSANKKKAPLAVRAALAEKKEKRLQELEEENPEKAEAKKDKIRWQNAETRLKGDKVRDDATLLRRSLKRKEKAKEKSAQKWAERNEKIETQKKQKQDKRKENIKKRTEQKKSKKGTKPRGKPGF